MFTDVPFLSVFLCRFCAGDWTRDLLQDRALHTPLLLLLLGHSSMPAGHNGRSHAHLEHFTSPRWLPCTSSYNHQSLTGIAFPPASRQWLRGVTLLSHRSVTDYSDGTVSYPCWSSARSLLCDSQEKRTFMWFHISWINMNLQL